MFKAAGVKKVIVISPHCFETFNKEYGAGFEVIHFSELLADLIKTGKVKPEEGLWRGKGHIS